MQLLYGSYGYKKFVPLTIEEILKRITQKEIFECYLKKEVIVGKENATYVAPYRNDSNPDCYFEEFNDRLYFIDFADIDKKSKDCIYFVKRILGVSYTDTLIHINETFNLGLGDSLKTAKEITIENSSSKEVFNKPLKKKRTITILPRNWNYKDSVFWSKYEISKENLISDGVLPVDIYKSINKKEEYFSIKPLDICYAYTDFEDKEKKKIYRPKSNKKDKWFTNCNQNDIGSMEFLDWKGDLLIISKSYKDCRVLRNQNLQSIWLQNEGAMPSISILTRLCKRFTNIVVWFDNDQTGIATSNVLVSIINSIFPNKSKSVFLPPKLLSEGIKDPSDLIYKKGRKKLVEFIKDNILTNKK